MKCHQVDAGLEREGEKRQESGRGQDIDDSLLHTPSSSFEDRSISRNHLQRSPCSDFKRFVDIGNGAESHAHSRWGAVVRGINWAEAAARRSHGSTSTSALPAVPSDVAFALQEQRR